MTRTKLVSLTVPKKEQYEKYAYFVGRKYREAKNMLAEIRSSNEMNEYDVRHAYGVLLVAVVEQSLPLCSETTQQIIRKGYLEESPTDWYEEYYSKGKYRNLKYKALKQFVDTMENLEKTI